MKKVQISFTNPFGEPVKEAWCSERFVAGLFEARGYQRLSIARQPEHFTLPLSWEELMQVKRDCGFGELDAVEVYPADEDVFNTSNIRHLFFVGKLPFAFRKNTHELQSSNTSEK